MKNSSKKLIGDDLPDGSVVTPTKIQPSLAKMDINSGFKTVVKPAAYIGSFLVDAATQKERTEIVYKKLENMRNVTQKKSVLLVISLSGIKVCNETGESVRMAHALRRISYATSDPDYCQFSFLAREPKGQANAQYCHTFLTESPTLAEELNDIVGEAFRLAYARQKQIARGVATKTPSFNDVIESQMNNNNNKNVTNSKPNKPQVNEMVPSTSSEIAQDSNNYNLLSSELPPRLPSHQKSISSDNSKKKRTKKKKSPKCSNEDLRRRGSSPTPQAPVAPPHRTSMPPTATTTTSSSSSGLYEEQHEPVEFDDRPNLSTTTDESPILKAELTQAWKQHQSPSSNNTPSAFVVPIQSQHKTSCQFSSHNKEFPPLPPQRMDSLPSYDLAERTGEGDESGVGTGATSSNKSTVAPSALHHHHHHHQHHQATSSDNSSGGGSLDPSRPHHRPSQATIPHRNITNNSSSGDMVARWPEKWYQPDIPRDVALHLLSQGQVGSFVVRDSTSHSGCYALSVRVTKATVTDTSSSIIHYLIVRTNTGFKLKGLEKEWPTMKSLVTHLSVMPEMLPCPLLLVTSKRRSAAATNASSISMETTTTHNTLNAASNPAFCAIDHGHIRTPGNRAGNRDQRLVKGSSGGATSSSNNSSDMDNLLSCECCGALHGPDDDEEDLDYQRLSDFSSIMADLFVS